MARTAWSWKPPARARSTRLFRVALYVGGAMPAAWTFYLGIVDQLGAEPMKALERALGVWALRFLIAGLAITPLRQLTGINLLTFRRALGLLAFFYASLHVLTYLWLDQRLALGPIWADIVKRPYITIGMVGFLGLIPLALTSHDAIIRRMGGRAWMRLHRLVYLIAAAGAIHFVLLVKSWPARPLVYAALVFLLLGYRVVRTRSRTPRQRPARA